MPLPTDMHDTERDPLRRIAARLLHDRADQDDALQEAWLTRLTSRHRPDDPRRWMAAVVRNRCRRLWDRRRFAELAQASLAPGEAPADPAEEVDRAMVRELLLATIDELPGLHSEVVRLRFFEELSLAEIAARTGRPMGTVKTHLSRGLAEMRRRLEGRVGDRRLTALLLVRGFDLDARELAGRTTRYGVQLAALAGVIASGALVALMVGTLNKGPGAASGLPKPELADVDTASVGTPSEAVGPAARGRAAVAGEVAGGPADGAALEPAPPPAPMRVTFTVVEPDGTPVPVFSVRADSPADPASPMRSPADGTDAVTLEVGPGDVLVEGAPAEDPGPGALGFVRFQFLVPGFARSPDALIPFVPGLQRSEVLAFGQPTRSMGIRVVAMESGAPIREATVRVGTHWTSRNDEVLFVMRPLSGTTGPDGLCRFEDLDELVSEIRIFAPGRASLKGSLTVQPGERFAATFSLKPAAPVSGQVRGADGAPVAGARVFTDVIEPFPEEWAVADAEGAFRLENLPPGDYRLWAVGPAGSDSEAYADTTEVRLRRAGLVWNPVLGPPFSLEVELVDPSGAPWAGTPLHVTTAESTGTPWDWSVQLVTDAAGRASVPRVPPEELRVEVRAAMGASSPGEVPLHVERGLRGGDGLVRVVVGAAQLETGSLVGRIHDANGYPGGSASMICCGPLVETVAARTSESGRFEWSGLAPGTYSFGIGPPAMGFWTTTVEVRPNETIDLGQVVLPHFGGLRVESGWEDVREGPLTYKICAVVETPHGSSPVLVFACEGAPPPPLTLLPGRILVVVKEAGENLQWRTIELESGGEHVVVLDPDEPPGDPAELGK